jgi:hypothetical protein
VSLIATSGIMTVGVKIEGSSPWILSPPNVAGPTIPGLSRCCAKI